MSKEMDSKALATKILDLIVDPSTKLDCTIDLRSEITGLPEDESTIFIIINGKQFEMTVKETFEHLETPEAT